MNEENYTEQVFKALGDSSRRAMLDLIKAHPGISVTELTTHFPFTRYAVMKHLRILENANLVLGQRTGRRKNLYLNAIPIQTIYDRWISKFSSLWASQLTALKYRLEKEQFEMPTPKPRQMYALYLKTTTQRLWEALTQPEETRQYFFGTEVISEFKNGSLIEYYSTKEGGGKQLAASGQILDIVPLKRLEMTFAFPYYNDQPSRVAFEIEDLGEVVKLTLIHDFEEESQTYQDALEGWPVILSGLKTVLETGQPLEMPVTAGAS
ncbi:MAG: SRPBCC domain-containing protein [Fidelibacterota bacterium]|nr:MAG: SRPBCC domain-containing protein [Candidatus Neomarinimicrobiota bacterium]